MAKIRVSQHSGRKGSAAHNDRSFLRDKGAQEVREMAPHIRADAMQENTVWSAGGEGDFREHELAFYRERYSAAVEATNARYRAQGHPERCRTIEKLYTGAQTRPEEMILQIGNRDEGADPRDFELAVQEYLRRLEEWNSAHGGHMHILNYAIHQDETSPHVHIRRVWDYTDKDGIVRLGQNKALQAAGVDLPHPDKAEGRYNNRKIKFDAMSRGLWQEIARGMGYEIETEPRPDLRHKDKAEYIAGQLQREIDSRERRLSAQASRIQFQSAAIDKRETYIERLDDAAEYARGQKLDALRERDAARASRDVFKQLQTLHNAVFRRSTPEVEVLAETEEKTTFTGKIRPSTVTITREDFDSLQEQADINGRVRNAARQITKAYNGMRDAAAEINRNRIDAHEVAVDWRVEGANAQIEDLERELRSVRGDLDRERRKSAALSERLQDERAENQDLRDLKEQFPDQFRQLEQERERLRREERERLRKERNRSIGGR